MSPVAERDGDDLERAGTTGPMPRPHQKKTRPTITNHRENRLTGPNTAPAAPSFAGWAKPTDLSPPGSHELPEARLPDDA